MSPQTREALHQAKCTPCEGGVASFSAEEAQQQLRELSGWDLSADSRSISKQWNCKDFPRALAFTNKIGDLAEREQHHPDLHLTGYRHLQVLLTTHAIQGLSINDFILAAKIDALGDPAQR